MNKPITFATIIAFLVISSAADAASCKFKVNEVDLFTKQKLVATEWYSMTSAMSSAFKILVADRTSVSVAAMSEGDQNFIAIKLKFNDGVYNEPSNEDMRDALLVEKGSQLVIILEDESQIVLEARKTVRGVTRFGDVGGNPVVKSNVVVHYPVGDEDIEALLEQNAGFVIVSATAGRFAFLDSNSQANFKMNRKGRDRFTEALTCLSKA